MEEASDRNDRVDADEPILEDVGDNGGALPLATLANVAVESRFEYIDAVEPSDILDARRERSAEMNNNASCSDIGDGPGTGGSGEGGGNDRGGFGVVLPLGCRADSGVESGVFGLGMCDGGAGNDDSSSGTALRLSARRSSVVVVVDMVKDGQRQE